MATSTSSPSSDRHLTRRGILTLGAAGIAGSLIAAPAQATSPIPTLPGETSRQVGRVTHTGKSMYDRIDVSINGDRTRLFVPHTTPPNRSVGAGLLWYYHANWSNHTALDSAFKYSAEFAVDEGVVCICPSYGGDQWVSQTAIQHQIDTVAYIRSLWRVGASFLRANSGGGALMVWAYGKSLVPGVRGMYLANAAVDMMDVYARDRSRVLPAYGNDPSTIPATNPASLPASAWRNKRIRAVVSAQDLVLPPRIHGQKLVEKALPVAAEATMYWHDGGHTIPGAANKDMLFTFQSWL